MYQDTTDAYGSILLPIPIEVSSAVTGHSRGIRLVLLYQDKYDTTRARDMRRIDAENCTISLSKADDQLLALTGRAFYCDRYMFVNFKGMS